VEEVVGAAAHPRFHHLHHKLTCSKKIKHFISDQLTILIKKNAKTVEETTKHTYICTHIVFLSKMK
jgi:hypothetical protein